MLSRSLTKNMNEGIHASVFETSLTSSLLQRAGVPAAQQVMQQSDGSQ